MEEKYVRTISWSTEDFESRVKDMSGDDWKKIYDSSKFAQALDIMIGDHDANEGISWSTIDYYLDNFCKNRLPIVQKYNPGTKVLVNVKNKKTMGHFPTGMIAYVLYSYYNQREWGTKNFNPIGVNDDIDEINREKQEYGIAYINSNGILTSSSWYYEEDLEIIE